MVFIIYLYPAAPEEDNMGSCSSEMCLPANLSLQHVGKIWSTSSWQNKLLNAFVAFNWDLAMMGEGCNFFFFYRSNLF